jgi:hypothetical protein
MRDSVGEINSVGEVGYQPATEEGGRTGTGPIDNRYPTCFVAEGNEVKARDTFERGERRGASVTKNEAKLRGMSSRK